MKGSTNFTGRIYKQHDVKIVNMVGQGNWSDVYQATSLDGTQKYAVKVMSQAKFKEVPKIKELLQAEKNILRNCDHPNVVKLYRDFREDQHDFMVLQFCDGGDLGDLLSREQTLPETVAIKYIFQILNGFKGLHKIHAIHRDFKVENVMLHEDCCKIVDLGFGKQLGSLQSVTQTKLGSNLTMAPEVMMRKPYGIKADIWSIGVVFYQLLEGTFPFLGRSVEVILNKIKKNEIVFSKGESDEAKDFIGRCLIVDADERIEWKEIYEHGLFKKFSSNQIVNNSQLLFDAAAENKDFYFKNNKIEISKIYSKLDALKEQERAIEQIPQGVAEPKIQIQKQRVVQDLYNSSKELSHLQNKDILKKYLQEEYYWQNKRLIEEIRKKDIEEEQNIFKQPPKNSPQPQSAHIQMQLGSIGRQTFTKAVNNARYVEIIHQFYLEIKDVVEDINHEQYLVMLWKDAYIKLTNLNQELHKNNVHAKVREDFVSITNSLIDRARAEFFNLVDIAKKRRHHNHAVFMRQASNIGEDYQKEFNSCWFDYIRGMVELYWVQLARRRDSYAHYRQKLVKYIFCLAEFSRETKQKRLQVKNLEYKISARNFDYQKAQINICRIMEKVQAQEMQAHKPKKERRSDHHQHGYYPQQYPQGYHPQYTKPKDRNGFIW